VTSVLDLWRVVDPDARLASGSIERLRSAVRGVVRSRAIAPHLPDQADGELLILDAGLISAASGLDGLIATFRDAGLRPAGVMLADIPEHRAAPDRAGDSLPILVSTRSVAELVAASTLQLERAEDELRRVSTELRLAAAEAALANPEPAAAAGLVAAMLRRGVAVAADGELRSLHPRPAGRALAARFAALHARLLAESPGRASARRTQEGLYLLERRVRPGASVWLFDDLPFARIDEVAADALTITMRALLRRTPEADAPPLRPLPGAGTPGGNLDKRTAASVADETLRATLLAVARANGRVAAAARQLGVHRNTVLYRLRRAAAELGVDPRRAADAITLLREAERQEDASG
jgi:PucR C-terminal helix-turn-helix domain